MAPTPDGKGYWLVAADGGIFSFGSAKFYGSMGGQHLNAPVVGMATAPDGKGYWLVAADGGIFSFGSAQFYGSMAAYHLAAPMVSIAARPGGGGYWTAAQDGGLFSFGNASYYGNIIDKSAQGSRPCSSSPGAGDSVTRWNPVIDCVLAMLGQPTSLENDVRIIIQHESSGRPDASSTDNSKDPNTIAGHPSEGLVQVIPSTFEAYRSPLLSDQITDPAANIYAGLNYGIHHYGGIAQIPGVVRVNKGESYAPY
jgi:hypothetical protein